MASIMNGLNIGYTGLSAAQVGINTTSQNISNAEVEGYSRQRVITSASTPLFTEAGNVGNGVDIQSVERIFDNFVFDRYTGVSADKEYSDYEKATLEELSSYFPEVDGVGIKADLEEYYNMWQTFADNPDNDAIKIALTSQTQTLTNHIQDTQNKVLDLQKSVNEQLVVSIDEVNRIAKDLADLNTQIDIAESGDLYTANDLRDKRNVMEKDLARLIGGEVNQGQLESNIQIDSNANMRTGSYTLSVNGFNIVDGSTYHPLYITNEDNEYGFYEVSYERQDGVLIPMEEEITGGKIGAIFDLRGGRIDGENGMPVDGVMQDVVVGMDAFAKGLIESTNNLYAQSAKTSMQSNPLEFSGESSLVSSDSNINEGSFDMVVYDIDGNEVARRNIEINAATSLTGTNSIEEQLKANKDDNNDLNGNNDIDDYLGDGFSYVKNSSGYYALEFNMDSDFANQGYTFSIEDKLTTDKFSSGTNFAGALGLGRYFDGTNARDITLNSELKSNPTTVASGYSSSSGDNRLALDMVQQQFEEYDFDVNNATYTTSVYGMYDMTVTSLGIATNSAISRNETVTTQFNATEMEYFSVSKVSIDEEMTNLIKYQTAYGAAAKIITTIDEMMQTLLGIKQ
jgi:flagellar hook-associated protein 1 FlgK